MLFTLALLALLVLAWLSYSVVLALLERRDRRDLYKRAAAEIRRRPPTMPPRTPRPAKGFFGSIPPYPMPAPAPPHVSTMPYGEGPRIADAEKTGRRVAELLRQTERAHWSATRDDLTRAGTVVANTGDSKLDEILNAPEPGPGAGVDELMRAAMTPRELERWNNRMIADAVRMPAWQVQSGSILDNPPPYVQQAMDELERPARNQKILQERRASRPPLDHSSDADPWLQ